MSVTADVYYCMYFENINTYVVLNVYIFLVCVQFSTRNVAFAGGTENPRGGVFRPVSV